MRKGGKGVNGDEFKQGMSMVTELNDNVLKLYCHVAEIDAKIKNLTNNKLDKLVFEQWSALRDTQLNNMKESYDTALNNMRSYIDKEIDDIRTNKSKKGKKNLEEPMLSKQPINCGSCNREILHAKLSQPDHMHYNA